MEPLKIKNPFQLFPEEVWEATIDQMEDSKDILALLRGIPKLDISISNRKRFWLIGEILPSLYKLINQKDVLNLRLVCKDWQRRVDHFLQNQPYYRAYSEDLHKDNPKFWAFLEKYERSRFKGRSPFSMWHPSRSSLLIEKMLEHPRNPFVFREIEVDIVEIVGNYENHDMGNKRLKIMRLLQRFGTHLWYINITLYLPEYNPRTNNLGEMLKLVPNLKRLTVHFEDEEDIDDDELDELSVSQLLQNLPELPFLETLEIKGNVFHSSTEVGALLLKRYGPQLRRIVAPEDYWWEEDTVKVTKLTELDVKVRYSNEIPAYYYEQLAAIKNILGSIRSANLVKLQIWFCNEIQPRVPLGVEQDILTWLKRFPSIKYLQITPDDFNYHDKKEVIVLKEEGTADPVKDLIPSLQTLKIANSPSLSYNFFRCFPSLQDLELRTYSFPTVEDLSIPDSGVKLREQIQTGKLYESNIWEVLPKLRKACLVHVTENQFMLYHFRQSSNFYRETYEKLKIAGRLPAEPQLHAYRKDVRNFISDSAMDNQRFYYDDSISDSFKFSCSCC